MAWQVAAVLVAALWGTQLWLRSFRSEELPKRSLLKIWAVSAVLLAAFLLWKSAELYFSWSAGALTKLFLPPSRSWTYFLSFVLSRFWSPWLIALISGIAALFAAICLNRRAGDRFFYEQEPYMFGLMVFLTGYPGWIFYLLLLGFAAVSWIIFGRLRGRGRAPLIFLWFPVALFAILITYGFVPGELLAKFNL